jgi:hypothetical protein
MSMGFQKQEDPGMKKMRVATGLSVACFLAGISTWSAVTAANEPRVHDRGFFLRLSAGGGAANTSIDLGPADLEFSGASGDINFAIGAIVSPNLAIHGTIFGWSVSDPDVELGGQTGEAEDVTLSLSCIGPGITYYIHPANVYLSASVGAAVLTAEEDGDDFETDTGVAADLTVGKEWWVGGKWGLGVAGGINFHSVPSGEPELDENFSGVGFGVRFSATFN